MQNYVKFVTNRKFFDQNVKKIWPEKRNLYLCTGYFSCPGGGIGRRAGLKHQWGNAHAGSIPALGTKIASSC